MIFVHKKNPPHSTLTSHLGSSRGSVDSPILGVNLALIDNTARMTGATIKTRMHAMPAPTVLLETTLLLNVLSENHQGTAAKSTSSHDAVESSIIELGFIGCIAEGKAGATTVWDRN
jgi:hypothetical protein